MGEEGVMVHIAENAVVKGGDPVKMAVTSFEFHG
jgi:hypothetical protein